MPINAVKEGTPKHPGFDALCRILAGGGHVSTMQATNPFFARNSQYVEKLLKAVTNASTNREVHGARLTSASIGEWDSTQDGVRAECSDRTERMLLADQEDERRDAVICGDMGDVVPRSTVLCASVSAPTSEVDALYALAQYLVDVIDQKPFQAHHWRKPWGSVLGPPQGWKNRHESYFWPNPRCSGEHNHKQIEDFVSRFRRLVEKIASKVAMVPELSVWTGEDQDLAAVLAKEISAWGGLGQDTPMPEQVFKVVCNAVSGRVVFPDALMNSRWTKIAAFASEATQGGVEPQAIWDSRVSTGVIRNLDSIVNPSARVFADLHLTLIPGRGGTRPEVQNMLRSRGWRYGWGGNNAWRAHFAGAKIITQIRDILNANPTKFGAPADSDRWSVRAVEMALFMEGY